MYFSLSQSISITLALTISIVFLMLCVFPFHPRRAQQKGETAFAPIGLSRLLSRMAQLVRAEYGAVKPDKFICDKIGAIVDLVNNCSTIKDSGLQLWKTNARTLSIFETKAIRDAEKTTLAPKISFTRTSSDKLREPRPIPETRPTPTKSYPDFQVPPAQIIPSPIPPPAKKKQKPI